MPIRVATVANFPGGDADLDDMIASLKVAVDSGADEIDWVFPYKLLTKDPNSVELRNYLAACKRTVGNLPLKTILESIEGKPNTKKYTGYATGEKE